MTMRKILLLLVLVLFVLESAPAQPPAGRMRGQGPGPRDPQAVHLLRNFVLMRAEAERLKQQGIQIETEDAEIRKNIADDPQDENLQRAGKIITLRRQLNELEREDFAARVEARSEEALGQIERELQKTDSADQPADKPTLERMHHRIKGIRDAAAQGFDALYERLVQMGQEAANNFAAGNRDQRFLDEIQLLRDRLERLESQFDSDAFEDDWDMRKYRSRPDMWDRPRMHGPPPEDMPLFMGIDDPPPGVPAEDLPSRRGEGRPDEHSEPEDRR
jgi:hypothetical protein